MSDAKIVTLLGDHADKGWDEWWIEQNLEAGEEALRRIPAHYADATVTVPEVADWFRALVAHAATKKAIRPCLSTGPSLMLLGSVGAGKTHQAYGVVRAFCVSGLLPGWVVATAADIYAQLRPRHGVDSEEVFERITRSSLLVVDDLGAAKGSEWNEEINYRLVNHRYEHDLPTLITSNVPPAKLREVLGERVTSRLREMATTVPIKGNDRRQAVKAA